MGALILICACLYFIFIYHKTIVYKCSNQYNPGVYSTDRLDKKLWSCKISGSYSCENCEYDAAGGEYITFKQLRKGEKKDFIDSYDYLIFNMKTKKKIATFEKTYSLNVSGDTPFVYEDSKAVAIKLFKFDSDEKDHAILYNFKNNKETISLNTSKGFNSRRTVISYNNENSILSDNLDIDEDIIYNDLIIASESKISDISGDALYGLININTGEVVIPLENSAFYRTQYGNYIGTVVTSRGPVIKVYDENGNLKFDQGQLLPNPSFVVEDAGNNYMLVDNLINYDSKYFELMDYSRNSIQNSKIYWSDIIDDLLKQIKENEYKDKITNITDTDLIEAYNNGALKISCSRGADDNIYVFMFSYFDTKKKENTYYPLLAMASYEFDMNTHKMKKLDN